LLTKLEPLQLTIMETAPSVATRAAGALHHADFTQPKGSGDASLMRCDSAAFMNVPRARERLRGGGDAAE
jgi:hypothetical protein